MEETHYSHSVSEEEPESIEDEGSEGQAYEDETAAQLPEDLEGYTESLEQDDFEVFSTFKTDEWFEWITAFLNAQGCTPELFIGNTEPHLALRSVYHLLPTDLNRHHFATAVTQIFESTTAIAPHAEKLYQLIQLIAYLKPRAAKAILEQELWNRTFLGLLRNGLNLHTELLVARSHYQITEDFSNFIYSSSAEIDDFSYQLACLRGLAVGNGNRVFPFLSRFIPYLDVETNTGQLGLLMHALLEEVGYRGLYEWYLDASLPQHPDRVEGIEIFDAFLAKYVLADWDSAHSDPYEILLSVLFRAKHKHLTPDELLYVARLHRHFQGIMPIVHSLEYAYFAIKRWSQMDPWVFCPLNEYSDSYLHTPTSVIEVIGKQNSSYDSEKEPTVELIFQKVRNRYESRPKAKTVPA